MSKLPLLLISVPHSQRNAEKNVTRKKANITLYHTALFCRSFFQRNAPTKISSGTR